MNMTDKVIIALENNASSFQHLLEAPLKWKNRVVQLKTYHDMADHLEWNTG